MEWATKLLLIIFLDTIILQNGIESTNPLDALYHKMFMELSRQSQTVFYARTVGDRWLPVLSKLEMGRHIYAKIDLLEGILAELQAKRGQIGAEREYFLDKNAMEIFLEFVKKRGQKVELFSDFPNSKFENNQYYVFMNDNEWLIMDELLGRKYPALFFAILDRILAMQLFPVEIDPETSMPAPYREFQNALFTFIARLKLEIVVGQTYYDFYDLLKGRIQRSITEIQKKIDEGPKGILSKGLHPQKAIKSYQQKPLLRKYEHLGEISLELFKVLAPEISQLLDKKAKKEVAKLSEEAMQLASEVKKAFAKILSEKLASTSRGTSAHSMGSTMLEIQSQLCLPNQWLDDQKELYAGAGSEARLLSSIHMNTAMLLLAYERVAKFYD